MEIKDYKSFEYEQLNAAKTLRKQIAQEISPTFLANFKYEKSEIVIKQTLFNEILERNALENPIELIAFSMEITECAVKKILDSDLDIYKKISLINYIVELGAKEFHSPYNIAVVKKNLSSVKKSGYFFTPVSLALKMVQENSSKKNVENVLDPACGIGVLLAVSLIENPSIKHVTGIEVDCFTAKITTKLLEEVCSTLNINPTINIINCDYLDYINQPNHIKFDLVVMNPPYGQIKFLNSSLTDSTTKSLLNNEDSNILAEKKKNATKELSAKIRNKFSAIGLGKGTPELSKIFLGSVLKLLNSNGLLIAITPSSWLGDFQGIGLRNYILNNYKLKEVWNFREDAKLFNGVNQPTCVVIITEGEITSEIVIKSNLSNLNNLSTLGYKVHLNKIKKINPSHLPIPQFGDEQLNILLKLHSNNSSIKDFSFIKNLRGELDLTKYKKYIKDDSLYPRLIRGDHIDEFHLKDTSDSEKSGYVDAESFKLSLGSSPKLKHIDSRRLAIPQCSYLQQQKRIKACIVEKSSVIGNSCNYIYLDEELNFKSEWLKFLCIVLNSNIIEWRFRIFNSNNHIANYEIDELPLVDLNKIDSSTLSIMMDIFNDLLVQRNPLSKIQLNALIALIYNITKEELTTIYQDLNIDSCELIETIHHYTLYMDELFKKDKSQIPNHNNPTLSDLDLEMIKHVPQGGNWTSIPEHVPSQRLHQIREQSKSRGMVRTTYYGRLRPDQPAYTIATSFNRPGNGTNIHPWEDRTITAREAARLQSFPDDFIFYGSEGAIRTQIGNAVPPLLSYAVGKKLTPDTFVDLFAGAGGLSYGLELAGAKCIAALEQNKYAAETFRNNHSSNVRLFEGDITQKDIRKELISHVNKTLNNQRLDLLAGGPPCQGFSTAGWRNPDDSRNVLVTYFLEIAEALKPRMVLIENVEGILSYDKGNVIKSIKLALEEIGYKVIEKPWILNAEEYGVPQMRRRVFILATLDSKELFSVPSPNFDKCKGRRETEHDKLHPLLSYPITVGEALGGLPPLKPQIYTNREYFSLYNDWCKKIISTEELLFSRGNNHFSKVELIEEQLSLF